MVIGNLYVVRAVVLPAEADAPLIVDADAVLALALPFQSFEAITRWGSQVPQRLGSLDHFQFPARRFLKRLIAPDLLIVQQPLGIPIAKAPDHDLRLFRNTERVKRNVLCGMRLPIPFPAHPSRRRLSVFAPNEGGGGPHPSALCSTGLRGLRPRSGLYLRGLRPRSELSLGMRSLY